MAIHGYIKNRPIRIGILIRDGSFEDLKKASFINSILWGGIYNPIIPINSEDNKFAVDIIKLYELDCLYPIVDSKEILEFLGKFSELSMEEFRIDRLFDNDNDLNYLDLYDIAVSLYNKEYKHKLDGYKSNFLNLTWGETDSDYALKSVLFGTLHCNGLETKHDYKKLYNKFLLANTIDITGNTDIGEVYKGYKVIGTTGIYLDYGYGGKGDYYGIYIGKHDSFIDLLYFWNLRALGKYVIFQPIELDNYLGYTKKYIDDISEDLKNSRLDGINIYYTSQSCLEEEKKQVIDKLNITNDIYVTNLSAGWFDGMNLLFRRHYAKITKTSIGHIEERPSFTIATFPISNENIFDDVSKSKKLVYSISASLFGKYNNSTFSLPIHKGLNNLYKQELFSHHFLQSSRDGLDILEDFDLSYISIKPVEYYKIVSEIFKLSGCKKIELSKSGLQTKKILEQMDYKERDFFGSRIFKISTVRKLINSMKSEDSIERSGALKILYSEGEFDKFKSLYIERRKHNDLKTGDVFDYLLSHNIFRPGLEMECRECGLRNWLSLRNIDEEWICEYCGHEDIMATYLGGRNEWKFRLSGLFSKDNNQEGAIPVILTLLTFDSILDSNFIHGLSLNLDYGGINKCETDIVIINQEEGLGMVMNNKITIEVGVGEIKTKSNIEQNDIDNLKYVRERLIEQGFTPYLIFAKTTNSFTEEEIIMFKKLKDNKIDIILFTNDELEKDDHIYSDKDVRYKYARNLYEVSENSKEIYLNK